MNRQRLFAIVLACLLGACSAPAPTPPAQPKAPDTRPPPPPGVIRYEVFGQTYETIPSSLGYLEIGVASWYGRKFHGRLTSNGEKYDMYKLSAAHKTLPLPTWVRVTNLDNGKKVVLRINDRGPFHDDRLIDLSYAAARELGYADQGIAPVVVEALDERNYPDLVREPPSREPSYYLQAGAYSTAANAEQVAERVLALLGDRVEASQVKVLESETADDRVLHKVFVGPVDDLDRELEIERQLYDGGLGKPIRVTLD